MIIVNQDKDTIINFDNIQDIRIEEYGTHVKGKKIYKIYSGNFEGYATFLGMYETKKRAKEVLQEIIEAIRGKSEISITQGEIKSECFGGFYEMPED